MPARFGEHLIEQSGKLRVLDKLVPKLKAQVKDASSCCPGLWSTPNACSCWVLAAARHLQPQPARAGIAPPLTAAGCGVCSRAGCLFSPR